MPLPCAGDLCSQHLQLQWKHMQRQEHDSLCQLPEQLPEQCQQLQEQSSIDLPVTEEARQGMFAVIFNSIQSASVACGRSNADVHRYARKIEVSQEPDTGVQTMYYGKSDR